MVGSPVIQPKAGAVKALELSLYYSSIYIYKWEPQRLFARVCTLHTLAALHICYSLRSELLVLDLSRYGGI